MKKNVVLFHRDIPSSLVPKIEDLCPSIAIDCEAMGLNFSRDRLCLVQISNGLRGNVWAIQIEKGQTEAPNLCKLLENPNIVKLFHYGRFDIAAMYNAFGTIGSTCILYENCK